MDNLIANTSGKLAGANREKETSGMHMKIIRLVGVVFLCDPRTEDECLQRRLLGMPASQALALALAVTLTLALTLTLAVSLALALTLTLALVLALALTLALTLTLIITRRRSYGQSYQSRRCSSCSTCAA